MLYFTDEILGLFSNIQFYEVFTLWRVLKAAISCADEIVRTHYVYEI
jgi:hypothetical protein